MNISLLISAVLLSTGQKVLVRSLRKAIAHQVIGVVISVAQIILNKKHIEFLYLCSYQYQPGLLYPLIPSGDHSRISTPS